MHNIIYKDISVFMKKINKKMILKMNNRNYLIMVK